jgi:hypothetical protein
LSDEFIFFLALESFPPQADSQKSTGNLFMHKCLCLLEKNTEFFEKDSAAFFCAFSLPIEN